MEEKRVFKERTNFVLDKISDKPAARDTLSSLRLKLQSKEFFSPSINYTLETPSDSSLAVRNHSLKGSSQVLTVQRTVQGQVEITTGEYCNSGPQQMATYSKISRNKRYSKAEQELIDTFARCQQEKSPQELQIESLRKATSILNTHIANSKERLGQLRVLLADRGVEPDLYKAMQCERWMEEKRQLSTVAVSNVLSATLLSLPTSTASAGPLMSRTESNLVRFLESPRRRIPTRNHARRVYVASILGNNSAHNQEDALIPQRKTSFIKGNSNHVTSPIPLPATPVLQLSSSSPNSAIKLPSVDENVDSSPEGDINHYVQAVSQDLHGSITIWKDSPRSKEEILAELVVDMPDYVNHLLSELDSTSYTPASFEIPEPIKTPRSTFSRASFMPETPRSSHAHKSPSRKRISGLFALPEALSSRKTVNIASDRPKHLSTPPIAAIAEETSRPFSVSLSGLPSSESGGSHDHGAGYKPSSRLRHRLSFFKRH